MTWQIWLAVAVIILTVYGLVKRYEPESYILVTRFPRSWRNISRRHGITS